MEKNKENFNFKEIIISFWQKIKNFAKKIWTKVLNFINHIKNFFVNLKNAGKLKESHIALSIKIKEMLQDSDNYNTVDIGLSDNGILNTIYDTETGLLDIENSLIVNSDTLDEDTKNKFGNKNILIIK